MLVQMGKEDIHTHSWSFPRFHPLWVIGYISNAN